MTTRSILASGIIPRFTPRSRSFSPGKTYRTSSVRKIATSTVQQRSTPLRVIFANQFLKSNSLGRQISMHSNCPPLRSSSLVGPIMTPTVRRMSTESDCEPSKDKGKKQKLSKEKEKEKKPKSSSKKKANDKRADCETMDIMPRCSPGNLEKTECMKQKKANAGKKPSPFKSFWQNPECCLDPCPDQFPRFDDLYWKPSDKTKQKYARTWAECPDVVLPKKVCCIGKIGYPKLEKRKKKDRPKTACEPSQPECPKGDQKCRKITMPHCRPVRESLKCKVYRGPSNCMKVCAPHPSFSECQKPKKKPKRPVECECLRLLNMCEVFEQLRKQNIYKK